MLTHVLLILAPLGVAPQAPLQADEVAQLAALCPLAAPANSKTLLRDEEALLDTLELSRTVQLWGALGCTRIHLALTGTKAPGKRAALAMPSGQGWLEGGINALLREAEGNLTASGMERMALAASVALRRNPSPNWVTIDRLAELIMAQIALKTPVSDLVKSMCPRLLLAVSDTATARECLRLTDAPQMLPVVRQLVPSVELHVQYFRLWEPELLIPQALVTYRYRYHGASSSPLFVGRAVFETGAEIVAPPCSPPGGKMLGNRSSLAACQRDENYDALPTQEVHLTMWDAATRTWNRQFRSSPIRPDYLIPEAEFWLSAQGYLRFDASIEASSWSIGIRLEKANSGGRASGDHLVPLSHDALYLSDLVLGTEASKLQVAIGRDSVWVAPENRMPRRQPLHLYFQAGSDIAMPEATTTIRVFELGQANRTEANSVTLTVSTPLQVGLTSVQKVLGITTLKPGNYQIEVVVRDSSSGKVATRGGAFVVVK